MYTEQDIVEFKVALAEEQADLYEVPESVDKLVEQLVLYYEVEDDMFEDVPY